MIRICGEKFSPPESFRAWEMPVPKMERTFCPQLLAAGSSCLFRFALARTRLVALFFRFAHFAFRLLLDGEGCINPFQIGDRSGIALALTEFHNPRVTAIASSCTRCDLVEQFFHGILLPQYGKGSAAGV